MERNLSVRILTLVTILLGFAARTDAQEFIRRRIEADARVSAGNYNLYPEPECAPQTAPEGFKAFYISHYARHGSRYLISAEDYEGPLGVLRDASAGANLTPLGESVLKRMELVCDEVRGRYEELTPKGAAQHAGIARRMATNFPELFDGGARVRARSTTVVRCILSMTAFTNSLASCCPGVDIQADASRADMVYMNWHDNDHIIPTVDTRAILDDVRAELIHPERFMATIFKNPSGVPTSFFRQMFEIAGNVQNGQSAISFYDLFTSDELYGLYASNNLGWYFDHGNAPISKGVGRRYQTNLLRKIIAQADEAIAGGGVSADLRFGHDGNLSSLMCLMSLGDNAVEISDYQAVTDKWNITDIIPMAANLQMVFYRNDRGEVILQFLHNERSITLPIAPYAGNFYRWPDVRAFWMRALQTETI